MWVLGRHLAKEFLDGSPVGNPRLSAPLCGFQGCGGRSETYSSRQIQTSGQGRRVGAVKHVAAAGGVDRIDLERRLVMGWFAVWRPEIPTTSRPAVTTTA